MRRVLARKIICIFSALLSIIHSHLVSFADNSDYEWSTVPLGAHGFITGMAFHPLEKDEFPRKLFLLD